METQTIVYPSSNRIGKFNVMYELMEDGLERPMLQALFGLCIVLEVLEHESGRGKTYIAASELFQALAEGEEIHEYRIDYVRNQAFPNPEHEARRLNSGVFGFVATRQIIIRVPSAKFSQQPRVPGSFH